MTALSRRSTGRIIALGASLTLALAGSAALATAASAEPGKGQGQGQEQNKPAETGKPADSGKPAETGGNQGGGNAGGNDGGAKPGQEVCGPLDSGKIDYSGGSVTVTAPEGNLVTGYCVKAGSDQSTTDGAVQYVTLETPSASWTFSHYSGKSISHYSFSWAPAGTPVTPVITKEYWKTCLADDSVITYERTVTDGKPGDWTPALAAGVVPGNGNGSTNPNAVLTCGGGGTVITIDETPTEVAGSVEATVAEAASPESVSAVAPANVAKPAPATVAVPAAATLPAGVPAGEGSDAPVLPTWALAMIALGTLGAAVAGKQLVKNN